MTINRSLHMADLDIYFHMRNHYNKLRNVKSTIDTSAPQGFRKSCPTPTPNNSSSSLGTSTCGERLKGCLHVSRHPGGGKQDTQRHSVGSQSDTIVRSSSLPLRPITRRHPFEMPHKLQCKLRSQSVGPTTRKGILARLNNKVTKKRRNSRRKSMDQLATSQSQNKNDTSIETDEKDGRSRPSWQNKGKVPNSRMEEQEYLQFLLRITEDIIVNNYHTSEEVERVFQNHVQANKGYLKMDKMRAQLVRLCAELNIPYNNNDITLKMDDCYQNFFETDFYHPDCQLNVDNCECARKRLLNLGTKDQDRFAHMPQEGVQDFIFTNEAMQASFMCKHSLSQVTECTEPSNSLDTLLASTKHPSGTTVSSLGNSDVLPGLETANARHDKELLEEVVGKILSREILANKGASLTEKEKNACAEEECMFKKRNAMFPADFKDKYVEKIDFVTVIKDDKPLQNGKSKDEGVVENIASVAKNVANKSEINDTNKVAESVHATKAQIAPRNCSPVLEISDKRDAASGNSFKATTHSKHTQISASYVDKQCNTSLKLKGHINEDDYVLVNSPIYVLKTLLDSDERFILYDNKTELANKTNAEVSHPDGSVDRAPALVGHPDASAGDPRRANDYSKLLNSDYDLTPQRESNNDCAVKYHHLSIDASTSISNMNLGKRQASKVNCDGLLLTEGYTVQNAGKEFETGKALERDSFSFSRFGQYEMTSFTVPQAINKQFGMCGCSSANQTDKVLDQVKEHPLGDYEIYPQGDSCGGNNYDTDANEDGRPNVKLNEEVNPQGAFRSERGQNSNRFPTLMNLLGKRKIKQP